MYMNIQSKINIECLYMPNNISLKYTHVHTHNNVHDYLSPAVPGRDCTLHPADEGQQNSCPGFALSFDTAHLIFNILQTAASKSTILSSSIITQCGKMLRAIHCPTPF